MKNGLSEKEAAEIRSGKKPQVDIDGSKKSLWGNLKNKAKNILKPFNAKKSLEADIANLKIALANNPSMLNDIRYTSNSSEHDFPSSFKDLAAKRERLAEDMKKTVYTFQGQQARNEYAASQTQTKIQSHENTLENISEVRDKAAQEMKLRSEARENAGIKDVQANSGIDKLAEKAEAMKSMTAWLIG